MGAISLLWGMLALLWMVLAFIPLLGWGNWLLIPFAAVGILIAAIALLFTSPGHRGRAKPALLLNGLVILVGGVRSSLGGGIIQATSEQRFHRLRIDACDRLHHASGARKQPWCRCGAATLRRSACYVQWRA